MTWSQVNTNRVVKVQKRGLDPNPTDLVLLLTHHLTQENLEVLKDLIQDLVPGQKDLTDHDLAPIIVTVNIQEHHLVTIVTEDIVDLDLEVIHEDETTTAGHQCHQENVTLEIG